MKRSTKTAALVAAVAVLALAAADPASAATASGGNGALTSVYNWFISNVWAGLTLLGVVCVGLMFWLGRAAVYVIALGAVGGLIVKFAPDIAAFFA